jgi:hypothetical protein
MDRQPDPDHELQVARYLSAAYVAYVHGQGMDYTRKKYADSPVARTITPAYDGRRIVVDQPRSATRDQ